MDKEVASLLPLPHPGPCSRSPQPAGPKPIPRGTGRSGPLGDGIRAHLCLSQEDKSLLSPGHTVHQCWSQNSSSPRIPQHGEHRATAA